MLAGKFKWDVTIKKGRKKLLVIEAVYLVVYQNVPTVPEEPALAFLQKVGKFATYPYFRALVATLAAYARADIPILPVLK